jgi:hypothetical protein
MIFCELKTEHKFNNYINWLVIHLVRFEVDSFRSMKGLGVIPESIQCLKDLTVNLKALISRVGCHLTAIRYNARLLTPWKKNLQLVMGNLMKMHVG